MGRLCGRTRPFTLGAEFLSYTFLLPLTSIADGQNEAWIVDPTMPLQVKKWLCFVCAVHLSCDGEATEGHLPLQIFMHKTMQLVGQIATES